MLKKIVLLVVLLFATKANASALITGQFELLDHQGNRVSEASYNGKLRLVFFGYTRCPSVCPMTMMEVGNVLNTLGKNAEQIQPLFITIDPQNDDLSVLSQYVHYFHPAIVGLTGNAAQINQAAAAFNATFGGTSIAANMVNQNQNQNQNPDQDQNQEAEVYHSSYMYLMDRNGEFIDVFGYGTQAEQIAAAIARYL